MRYYADFKGGGVFEWSLVLLYSTIYIVLYFLASCLFSHTDESSGIRKKFASLNPRIALLALVIRTRRWTWGGYYSCWLYDISSTTVTIVRPASLRLE